MLASAKRMSLLGWAFWYSRNRSKLNLAESLNWVLSLFFHTNALLTTESDLGAVVVARAGAVGRADVIFTGAGAPLIWAWGKGLLGNKAWVLSTLLFKTARGSGTLGNWGAGRGGEGSVPTGPSRTGPWSCDGATRATLDPSITLAPSPLPSALTSFTIPWELVGDTGVKMWAFPGAFFDSKIICFCASWGRVEVVKLFGVVVVAAVEAGTGCRT